MIAGVFAILAVVLALIPHSPTAAADTRPLALANANFFQPELPHETSWLGNSFGDGARNHLQVQPDIAGLLVTPDGTCYTNSYSADQSRMAGLYRAGQARVNVPEMGAFGKFGGMAIAVDSRYLYLGAQQENSGPLAANANGQAKYPPKGYRWFGIKRYTRDGLHVAPWPGGMGFDGDLLIVNSATDRRANVWGLACDGAGHLYVSDRLHNQIRVYDTQSLTQSAVFPCPQPRNLVWDAEQRRLWVLTKEQDEDEQPGDSGRDFAGLPDASASETASPTVLCFSPEGHPLKALTIRGIADPTAICLDAHGLLYVADNGPDQNIKIYETGHDRPVLVRTFGTRGGLFTGPRPQIGHFGDRRFDGLTGLGCDALGNLYVSSNGKGPDLNEGGRYRNAGMGTILQSYRQDTGALNWRLFGLPFVNCAQIDPHDETSAYTSDQHYRLNYATHAPGTEWSYAGALLNRFKYPEDYRLRASNVQRPLYGLVRVQGRLLLTLGADQYFNIYRFNPKTDGEIAIPSVTFGGPGKARLWTDTNGDGRHQSDEYQTYSSYINPMRAAQLDSNGDIWSPDERGIAHWPLQGFDALGNPLYSWQTFQTVAPPPPFSRVLGLYYEVPHDCMYLCGFTPGDAINPQETLGTTLVRYDHWSHGTATPAWNFSFLQVAGTREGNSLTPMGFAVAGDYLFVEYKQTTAARVYRTSDGAYVGSLQPDPQVTGDMTSIWVDYRKGIQGYQRANGEYIVFVEDDIYDKVLMYRWNPRSPRDEHSSKE